MPAEKSKAELVELVRRIMECTGSDEEIDAWMLEVENSVQHPSVSDLIFYPESDDVTPEEVVEEALAYKPLGLE